MKALKVALTVPLVVLPLFGCWDRTELNDLGLVLAAAIDKKDERRLELSVQVFSPKLATGQIGGSTGGGTGGAETKGQTLVRSATGANMADAVAKVQEKLPRKISWGHCKVFIFSDELAKTGISDEVDFLMRYPEVRMRAFVYVSRGKAARILEQIPPLEPYSAEVLRELSDLNIGKSVTVKELQQMLRGEGGSAVLPMAAILPPRKGESELQSVPYLYGTAVLRKDKLAGIINLRATRGVQWIRNELLRSTVTVKVKNEKGFVSFTPLWSSVQLVPRIEGDKWRMLVNITAEGNLVENDTRLNPMIPDQLQKMEQALKDDIETHIKLALKEVQKRLKADVLGFGEVFHRKYPQQWRRVKNRWEEIFPQVEVVLQTQAKIRRPGVAAEPAGIPEQEVKNK